MDLNTSVNTDDEAFDDVAETGSIRTSFPDSRTTLSPSASFAAVVVDLEATSSSTTSLSKSTSHRVTKKPCPICSKLIQSRNLSRHVKKVHLAVGPLARSKKSQPNPTTAGLGPRPRARSLWSAPIPRVPDALPLQSPAPVE